MSPNISCHIFINLFLLSNTVFSLEGPNVCIRKQKITVTESKPYQQPYQYQTFQTCFDPAQQFRCSVNKVGYKLAFKNVTTFDVVVTEFCCNGFLEIEERCFPAHVKINEHSDESDLVVLIIIVCVACVLFLIIGIIYYRRKYIQEREPLKKYYGTTKKQNFSSVDRNEFDNPLYDSTVNISSREHLVRLTQDNWGRRGTYTYETMPQHPHQQHYSHY